MSQTPTTTAVQRTAAHAPPRFKVVIPPMCKRSVAAREDLRQLVSDVRNIAAREAADPIEWATEVARGAARVLRLVERSSEPVDRMS